MKRLFQKRCASDIFRTRTHPGTPTPGSVLSSPPPRALNSRTADPEPASPLCPLLCSHSPRARSLTIDALLLTFLQLLPLCMVPSQPTCLSMSFPARQPTPFLIWPRSALRSSIPSLLWAPASPASQAAAPLLRAALLRLGPPPPRRVPLPPSLATPRPWAHSSTAARGNERTLSQPLPTWVPVWAQRSTYTLCASLKEDF